MSLFDQIDFDDKPEHQMPLPLLRAISIVPRIDSFFGAYLQSTTFEPMNELSAVMATDCVGKIFYNPTLMADPKHLYAHPPFLACAIVHELMHIFRMDWTFCKSRDMRMSNIALDAVINRDMLNSGYQWPRASELGGFVSPYASFRSKGFISSMNAGETATDVYDLLADQAKAEKKQPNEPRNGELTRKLVEEAIKDAGGADAVRRMVSQRAASAQVKAEAIEAAKSDAQKCADQDATASIKGAPNHGSEDELSTKVLSWLGLRVKRNVNPLANIAGSRMRQGMMSTTKKRQRSMLTPSPMTDALGYVVAGRKRFYDIRPAFAFDISGSIDVADVHRAGGEANGWSRGMVGSLAQIPVCFHNVKIVQEGSLSKYRNAQNIPSPCGGTNFVPVFKWASNLPRKPTHLVMWTDALGDWPAPDMIDKSMKLIIVITPEMHNALKLSYGRYYNALMALKPTIIESK